MILLDMNMQEKNGIEVAKELRSQKIETPIIYISAYIEMAPYGYVVNAFRYLLKNDLEETFCFAMDDVMKELKHHLETIEVQMCIRDRVTVARKIYRSGESEYLINGSPCLSLIHI